MIKFKEIIICFLFSIYFVIGLDLSLDNGISHDQFHEQQKGKTNFLAIKSVFFNNTDYKILSEYLDRYHGVGFHYISQPIQMFIYEQVAKLKEVSLEGSYYISRHAAVFLFFSISSYFFYLLSLKISNNKNFALISMSLFCLYPYFFGHAQINGKDIPFMSTWVVCTFFLFNIIDKFYNNSKIEFKTIFYLALSTAFLISIRISGILIFLEYLIALIIFLNVKKIKILILIDKNKYFFIFFFILVTIFTYALNPIFWHNPFEFVNSLKWMGKYYHDICTLTLGSCMRALNLPSSYIFIWFFFKLPILILLGLATYPLIEKKIFNNGINTIFYGTFSLTTLSILFIFIIKNVALYDEIRHVMFLIPFIFLIALYNIYIFNQKFFYYSSIILVIFFILENISLKNYQYTWLNSFAKFTIIQKTFEVDYMGISNKNLQKEIIKYTNLNSIDKDICIYGDMYVREFLVKKNFTCLRSYSELDSNNVRPLIAYQNVRNIKRSNPKDCDLIHEEKYQYSFSNQDVKVANLWFCD